ncbi:hydroxyisourate hydrolase [Plantactinospora sp. ZYX-F-223]|uniref:hydroxyisourate hydrolase n=1 Tax=Plantactinospora sp. ZYX-F-223 TaxID=3144103 RepID=UPI0031FC5DB9
MTDDRTSAPDGLIRISTHVLDTVRGEPAADVPVRLDRRDSGGWTAVAHGRTDSGGRLTGWTPLLDRLPLRGWQAGGYRLVFQVEGHFPPGTAFFPEIVVAFQVTEPDRHHHVPLLLSPYGYTTYRGS